MTTNDFYTTIKALAEERCSGLWRHCQELRKQIDLATSKVSDHENTANRTAQHIEKLRSLAGESLLDGQHSYEKYMTSLRDNVTKRDIELQAADNLKNIAIPRLRAELQEAEKQLGCKLDAACLEVREQAEKEMAELLGQLVNLHDDFLDAAEIACSDYRESYSRAKRGHVPLPQHPRFNPRRYGMVESLAAEDRAKRLQATKKQIAAKA